MSMDVLQEKIRKVKNPSMIDLSLKVSDLPPHLLLEEGSASAAYGRFCKELLGALKGAVPAVRVGFAAFAASFLVGLEWGIIRIATAPAAALMPAVIAQPFTLMLFPSLRTYYAPVKKNH